MKNSKSDKASITCGIPESSILGPMLFLIYINNMPQAADSELLLYASLFHMKITASVTKSSH